MADESDSLIRNEQIIAMAGKKSYSVIGQELGISRSAVAGVVFRHRHPNWRKRLGLGYRTGCAAANRLPKRLVRPLALETVDVDGYRTLALGRL